MNKKISSHSIRRYVTIKRNSTTYSWAVFNVNSAQVCVDNYVDFEGFGNIRLRSVKINDLIIEADFKGLFGSFTWVAWDKKRTKYLSVVPKSNRNTLYYSIYMKCCSLHPLLFLVCLFIARLFVCFVFSACLFVLIVGGFFFSCKNTKICMSSY